MARPTVYIVVGVLLIFLGIVVGWFAFPNLLRSKIIQSKQLKKGSEARAMWTNIPLAIDFKIYLWNVTNPDEIYKGAKPRVQEVGPFFYREWKGKVNLEDNPSEDTITYNMINTFYFDAEETKPLTGDEPLILPHILIMSLAQIVLEQKPSALSMINKAIPHLFGNPGSIFFKTTAREILFDGVTVNCTKAKEFAANSVCDQIRANPKGLVPQEDGTFKFSVFGTVNATANENTLTVKRGMKDVQEVGQVVLYNGKPKMEFWSGETCNQIKGTDTTIFPPFMSKEQPPDVWGFGAEVCRSLKTYFKEPKVYKGIPGLMYTADLGDMSTDPDLKCFCPTENTCLKKGTFDLTKCTGAPLIATLPHCLDCHEDYLNMVSGYDPSFAKHGIYSTFEPITGNPVEGHRRLQFNIWLFNISKISIMKDLPSEKILFPVVWLDEGVELNDTICATVRNLLIRPIKIVNKGRYVLIVIGFLLFGMAIFVYYKRTKLLSDGASDDNKTTTTQVGPAY